MLPKLGCSHPFCNLLWQFPNGKALLAGKLSNHTYSVKSSSKCVNMELRYRMTANPCLCGGPRTLQKRDWPYHTGQALWLTERACGKEHPLTLTTSDRACCNNIGKKC